LNYHNSEPFDHTATFDEFSPVVWLRLGLKLKDGGSHVRVVVSDNRVDFGPLAMPPEPQIQPQIQVVAQTQAQASISECIKHKMTHIVCRLLKKLPLRDRKMLFTVKFAKSIDADPFQPAEHFFSAAKALLKWYHEAQSVSQFDVFKSMLESRFGIKHNKRSVAPAPADEADPEDLAGVEQASADATAAAAREAARTAAAADAADAVDAADAADADIVSGDSSSSKGVESLGRCLDVMRRIYNVDQLHPCVAGGVVASVKGTRLERNAAEATMTHLKLKDGELDQPGTDGVCEKLLALPGCGDFPREHVEKWFGWLVLLLLRYDSDTGTSREKNWIVVSSDFLEGWERTSDLFVEHTLVDEPTEGYGDCLNHASRGVWNSRSNTFASTLSKLMRTQFYSFLRMFKSIGEMSAALCLTMYITYVDFYHSESLDGTEKPEFSGISDSLAWIKAQKSTTHEARREWKTVTQDTLAALVEGDETLNPRVVELFVAFASEQASPDLRTLFQGVDKTERWKVLRASENEAIYKRLFNAAIDSETFHNGLKRCMKPDTWHELDTLKEKWLSAEAARVEDIEKLVFGEPFHEAIVGYWERKGAGHYFDIEHEFVFCQLYGTRTQIYFPMENTCPKKFTPCPFGSALFKLDTAGKKIAEFKPRVPISSRHARDSTPIAHNGRGGAGAHFSRMVKEKDRKTTGSQHKVAVPAPDTVYVFAKGDSRLHVPTTIHGYVLQAALTNTDKWVFFENSDPANGRWEDASGTPIPTPRSLKGVLYVKVGTEKTNTKSKTTRSRNPLVPGTKIDKTGKHPDTGKKEGCVLEYRVRSVEDIIKEYCDSVLVCKAKGDVRSSTLCLYTGKSMSGSQALKGALDLAFSKEFEIRDQSEFDSLRSSKTFLERLCSDADPLLHFIFGDHVINAVLPRFTRKHAEFIFVQFQKELAERGRDVLGVAKCLITTQDKSEYLQLMGRHGVNVGNACVIVICNKTTDDIVTELNTHFQNHSSSIEIAKQKYSSSGKTLALKGKQSLRTFVGEVTQTAVERGCPDVMFQPKVKTKREIKFYFMEGKLIAVKDFDDALEDGAGVKTIPLDALGQRGEHTALVALVGRVWEVMLEHPTLFFVSGRLRIDVMYDAEDQPFLLELESFAALFKDHGNETAYSAWFERAIRAFATGMDIEIGERPRALRSTRKRNRH
jgi:hypothetical protein